MFFAMLIATTVRVKKSSPPPKKKLFGDIFTHGEPWTRISEITLVIAQTFNWIFV